MNSCLLCKEKSQLCKSHIIPEFMYATLYDNKHKFKQMTGDQVIDRPKGIYEKMLCVDCESKLNIYETYAKGILCSETWSNIKLVQKHEEKLREMILNADPGKPHDYPCIITFNTANTAEINEGLVIAPQRAPRFEGHRTYKIFMAGCFWVFLISSHTHKINSEKHLWLDKRGLIIHKVMVNPEVFLQALLK